MKIKRRRMAGRPLLTALGVAGAGLVACGDAPSDGDGPGIDTFTSGNLIAPPTVELCVEVEPPEAEAAVTIDGWALEEDGCNAAESWATHAVAATAEGFQDYAADVEVEEASVTHTVTLTPEVR